VRQLEGSYANLEALAQKPGRNQKAVHKFNHDAHRVSNTAQIEKIKADIDAFEVEKQGEAFKLKPEHPTCQALDSKIAELKRQLAQLRDDQPPARRFPTPKVDAYAAATRGHQSAANARRRSDAGPRSRRQSAGRARQL